MFRPAGRYYWFVISPCFCFFCLFVFPLFFSLSNRQSNILHNLCFLLSKTDQRAHLYSKTASDNPSLIYLPLLECRQQKNDLNRLGRFPHWRENTHFVFVPGPSDPGSGDCIPRPPLPRYVSRGETICHTCWFRCFQP